MLYLPHLKLYISYKLAAVLKYYIAVHTIQGFNAA